MNVNVRALSILGAVAALAMGCGGVDTQEAELGVAQIRQIDGGMKTFRAYTLTFADGTAMAEVFVMNQTMGSFRAGYEYWYVNEDSLSELGQSSLSMAHHDYTDTTPSPPVFTHEQAFRLTTNPSGGWGTGWTTDPLGGGFLYAEPEPGCEPCSVGLRLYKSSANPPTLTAVAWYQILPSGTSPSNITPDGTLPTATSITVPSGDLGYLIRQVPGG